MENKKYKTAEEWHEQFREEAMAATRLSPEFKKMIMKKYKGKVLE